MKRVVLAPKEVLWLKFDVPARVGAGELELSTLAGVVDLRPALLLLLLNPPNKVRPAFSACSLLSVGTVGATGGRRPITASGWGNKTGWLVTGSNRLRGKAET